MRFKITSKASQGQPWNVAMPSRGLGDTVAKVTHHTGVAAVVKRVSGWIGMPCRCDERQRKLNEVVPYREGRAG